MEDNKPQPETMPEFDKAMRRLAGAQPSEMKPGGGFSRDRAKAIILEIVRIGGTIRSKTRLYKLFYFAHLFYAKNEPDYLSDWPVVRMPHGPGIDDGESLIAELIEDGSIESRDIEIGPYPSTQFRPIRDGTPQGLSLAAIDAIKAAVAFTGDKSAAELSQLTHDYSHSWMEANDGDELDFYVDLLPADEYHAMRERMAKTAEVMRSVW